jgi:hypothetical protein
MMQPRPYGTLKKRAWPFLWQTLRPGLALGLVQDVKNSEAVRS